MLIKKLTVTKSPDEFTISQESIESLFEQIIRTEKERGNPYPSIEDVWEKFNGKKVEGVKRDYDFLVLQLLENEKVQFTDNFNRITFNSQPTKVKSYFDFLGGLIAAKEAIENGLVDCDGERVIFFTMAFNFTWLYCFDVCRGDGKSNTKKGQLRISVVDFENNQQYWPWDTKFGSFEVKK